MDGRDERTAVTTTHVWDLELSVWDVRGRGGLGGGVQRPPARGGANARTLVCISKIMHTALCMHVGGGGLHM